MASRTISDTAELVLSRNRLRKSWVIHNEDASIDCFIKRQSSGTPTVSTTDHDHRLAAGASISLSDFTDGKESVQDRWDIVAASGTPRISYFETEDSLR